VRSYFVTLHNEWQAEEDKRRTLKPGSTDYFKGE